MQGYASFYWVFLAQNPESGTIVISGYLEIVDIFALKYALVIEILLK